MADSLFQWSIEEYIYAVYKLKAAFPLPFQSVSLWPVQAVYKWDVHQTTFMFTREGSTPFQDPLKPVDQLLRPIITTTTDSMYIRNELNPCTVQNLCNAAMPILNSTRKGISGPWEQQILRTVVIVMVTRQCITFVTEQERKEKLYK